MNSQIILRKLYSIVVDLKHWSLGQWAARHQIKSRANDRDGPSANRYRGVLAAECTLDHEFSKNLNNALAIDELWDEMPSVFKIDTRIWAEVIAANWVQNCCSCDAIKYFSTAAFDPDRFAINRIGRRANSGLWLCGGHKCMSENLSDGGSTVNVWH